MIKRYTQILPFISYLPIISHHHQRIKYSYAFFTQSWRNRQYAITQTIKKCNTSDEVKAIIQKMGGLFNIVHLTAVLDRIQEQNMLNIEPIVEFVVFKLKQHRQFLLTLNRQNMRTVCNIVCYLGNLKNTELNYIFSSVNYSILLTHENTLEKTMLITGLIRLGIFNKASQRKGGKEKAYSLMDLVNETYSRNEIVSIWYAYISEISRQNEALNNYMNDLLGRSQVNDKIELRTYTYALVCYVKCWQSFKNKADGCLYRVIRDQIPLQSRQNLLPHQFSLLLQNIKRIKTQGNDLDPGLFALKQSIVFSKEFIKLLQTKFQIICKRKNVTLRNIANVFKGFNQCFGVSQEFFETVLTVVNRILKEQTNFAYKEEKYEMNYKVDLLSLGSLSWKLGEALCKNNKVNNSLQRQALYTKFVNLTISYIKMLKDKQLISKISNKEILMIYSGFSLVKDQIEMKLDQQFKQISIDLVCEQGRNFTVKEVTLIYTYFKSIQIYNPQFCQFVADRLFQLSKTQQFAKNPKGSSILYSQCKLSLGSKCFNCFHPKAKQNGDKPIKYQ